MKDQQIYQLRGCNASRDYQTVFLISDQTERTKIRELLRQKGLVLISILKSIPAHACPPATYQKLNKHQQEIVIKAKEEKIRRKHYIPLELFETDEEREERVTQMFLEASRAIEEENARMIEDAANYLIERDKEIERLKEEFAEYLD